MAVGGDVPKAALKRASRANRCGARAIQVWLQPAVIAALDEWATADERTRSGLCRKLIRAELKGAGRMPRRVEGG